MNVGRFFPSGVVPLDVLTSLVSLLAGKWGFWYAQASVWSLGKGCVSIWLRAANANW